MNWKFDGIDITAIAEKNDWHLASAVEELESHGIAPRDAEAAMAFIFASNAKHSDDTPEDLVTDEQWDRLTIA